MDVEEHEGVEDNLEATCEVCGVALTDAEIESSREAGDRFLCTTHAEEETPVIGDGPPASDPSAET